MKKVIPIFAIFSTNLFFALSALFGYEYAGSDESSIYMIYSVIIFVLSIILFLVKILFKKIEFNVEQFILLMLPFIVSISLLVSELLLKNNDITRKYFMYFILWSVPAIYMGLYAAKYNLLPSISKSLEIIMLILSIAVINSTVGALIGGSRSSIGGETYQTASYLSAFAFGLNIYYLVYGENHARYKFATLQIYRYICYGLLILQLLGVFASGGRGGFVLMVVYIVYIIISTLRQKKINKIGKLFIGAFIFILSIAITFPNLLKIPSFQNSFYRVFSYITPDGIDWTGTNRDYVYENAILAIKENMIFGYGIFNWGGDNYPHNFILELLLNGGVVYLTTWILVILKTIFKIHRMIEFDAQFRIILIMFLFPIVILMFSGSYSINTVFWFSISYILSFQFEKRIQSQKHSKY